MALRLSVIVAGLLACTAPALALEDQWGFGQVTSDWYYAEYTTAKRTVTMYCAQKENQFIYGMPAKDLDPVYAQLDYADIVLIVDARGEETTYNNTQVAPAKVEITADMIAFRVVGPTAWGLQSAFAFSDSVTVGVSQRYLPENPDLDGRMVYLTANRATEEAVHYVMGPCVPEGYNDQPSSEPGDATEGVSPG